MVHIKWRGNKTVFITGIDVSGHQYPPNVGSAPNYDTLKANGISFVIAKATEGIGYVNPNFQRDRSEAHRVGMGFGLYHFARGNNPLDEANYFCDNIGALSPGDVVVLDWEINNAFPVAWCRIFLDHVQVRTGVKPLLYLNKSTLSGYNWAPVVAGNYGLWLAEYDGNPSLLAQPAPWPLVAIKQYSDKGSVAGVAGPVDQNAFYGDLATFAKYGFQGVAPTPPAPAPVPAPAPAPAPAPQPAPGNPWDVLPSLVEGQKGEAVRSLQTFGNRVFPSYCKLPVTGWYGPQTTAFIAEFQRRSNISGGDGKNVGPQTKRALWSAGWRG